MVDDHADALMHQGVDGGLASAISRFLPEKLSPVDLAEIQQARQSIVAVKSAKDAALLFPGADSRPCYRVYEYPCGPDYRWPAGVYYHFLGKSSAKEPPALRDVRICGVLKAVAIARNRQGGEFGLLLEFRDRLGQRKQWNMPFRLVLAAAMSCRKPCTTKAWIFTMRDAVVWQNIYVSNSLTAQSGSHRRPVGLITSMCCRVAVLAIPMMP